jgi:hypothetical protein
LISPACIWSKDPYSYINVLQISLELRELDLLLWVNILTSLSQYLWQIIHFSKLIHSLGYFEQLGRVLLDFLILTFSEYSSEPNPIFYRVSKIIHTYIYNYYYLSSNISFIYNYKILQPLQNFADNLQKPINTGYTDKWK